MRWYIYILHVHFDLEVIFSSIWGIASFSLPHCSTVNDIPIYNDKCMYMYVLNHYFKYSVSGSPFFPGFLVPESSYQYSLISTKNLPLNTLTFTNRLLEICCHNQNTIQYTYDANLTSYIIISFKILHLRM